MFPSSIPLPLSHFMPPSPAPHPVFADWLASPLSFKGLIYAQ